ncbi:hypothetical protein AB834_03115 [PVC group bacterium (ex Bugula neritina AB1)]|nr:hypothetical protein AB834_03115 [PVC group bacterium (ex Bugula neritina AB1)]
MKNFLKIGKKGYSFFNMFVTLCMAGSLISTFSFSFPRFFEKSQDLLKDLEFSQIQIALEQYYSDNGHYPVGDNSSMVNALKDDYVLFSDQNLSENEEGDLFFTDPFGSPYYYSYKRGDLMYELYSPNKELPPSSSCELDNKELGSFDQDFSLPKEEPFLDKAEMKEKVLPLHAVPNSGEVFLMIYEVLEEFDSLEIYKKREGASYEKMELTNFATGGNMIWSTSKSTIVLDSSVKNDTRYFYQGKMWDSSNPDNVIWSEIVEVVPRAKISQKIIEAKMILLEEKSKVKDSYGLKSIDVAKNLYKRPIPIVWGYPNYLESEGLENASLAYIISFDGPGLPTPKEMIVLNALELEKGSSELLSTVLLHEGVHYYWNIMPPPLPMTARRKGFDSSNSLGTERERVGRNFDSIDEEYNAFLMVIRFWEKIRGGQKYPLYDEFIDTIHTKYGQKRLREAIYEMYQLEEY